MNMQEDFDTDWDYMLDKVGWLVARIDGSDDVDEVAQLREAVIGEGQDFLRRWGTYASSASEHYRVGRLEEMLAPMILKNQLLFTSDLHQVLHTRLWICCAKDDFETGVAEIVAEQAQEKDAATEEPMIEARKQKFRELENAVEQAETDFKETWAKFQSDWSGRVTAAIKERLGRPVSDDLSDWYEELAGQEFDLLEAMKKGAINHA